MNFHLYYMILYLIILMICSLVALSYRKHKMPKNITYTNWESKQANPKLYTELTKADIFKIKKIRLTTGIKR